MLLAPDPAIPRELRELATLLRPSWAPLLAQARAEGPVAALLETMHQEGHDYTFQQLRHYTEKAAGVGQEGVVLAGDYLVSQRAAGTDMSVDVAAGDAWVKLDTGTRNGLYLQTNDGVVNVPATPAHAALPRIDQLILQINDTNVPAGAGDAAELKILAGTATAGATLDNRLGAAILGNDRILLADLLRPIATDPVTAANIRSRRPWARGAHSSRRRANTAGTADLSLAAGGQAAVSSADYAQRIECSGGPVRFRVVLPIFQAGTGGFARVMVYMDGAEYLRLQRPAQTNTGSNSAWVVEATPPAGSHLFDLQWAVATNDGTIRTDTSNSTGGDNEFTVEEVLRQDANNGTS